ncbi:MAG: DUF4349 domain-containing protein [Oscillibacter sp.]
MRRKILAICLALTLLAVLLCGCGGTATSAPAGAPPNPSDARMEEMGTGSYGEIQRDEAAPAKPAAPNSEIRPAKRIYTATLEMETTGFDAAVQGLSDLVKADGGWFASSGVNEYGTGYRTGNYTVRIPTAQFDAFCAQAGDLCHLVSSCADTEDVSEYYYDTAGRLKTQETKLARLQVLLAQAETMEDLITVESAISETESAIESLAGELQHYDALVDYATVYINLREVYQLSNVEQPATGFFSRMGVALGSGWKGFVSGMESLAVGLAYAWMWILLLAGVVFLVIRVLRRRRKDRPTPPKLPRIHLKPVPTAPLEGAEKTKNEPNSEDRKPPESGEK